jgi:hypothetical protein
MCMMVELNALFLAIAFVSVAQFQCIRSPPLIKV